MRNEAQKAQLQNVIDSLVEVQLQDRDSFLKIRETLTRIGVPSKKSNTLYQSCHILHKQDKYYIVHFKELFMLDGRLTDFDDEDLGRRNTIVALLEQWQLVAVVDKRKIAEPKIPLDKLKIISFAEKNKWELQPKYRIGKFKQQRSSEINRDD